MLNFENTEVRTFTKNEGEIKTHNHYNPSVLPPFRRGVAKIIVPVPPQIRESESENITMKVSICVLPTKVVTE